MISRRELQLLLLAILFALILLALLVVLLPPTGDRVLSTAPIVESPPREERAPTRREPPPPQLVVRELLDRPDLIPFEGTLGGSMGFYTEENIQVLNEQWVFARFEDGHVEGSMLLEYALDGDGKLRWSVLAAELD